MTWLGDYPEDFTTVTCLFSTHGSDGAPIAPPNAFEAADVLIYKNGNAAQKTTTNGVTMTSPFDSIAGLHCLVIDTSNDTGDSGFWVRGAVYTLVLSPDTETIDSKTALKVIGQFSLDINNVAAIYSRLGAPAGASLAADVASVKTDTTNIYGKVDTEIASIISTLGTPSTTIAGDIATVASYVDTEVAAIKAKTDNLPSDPADASDIAAAFVSLAAHGDSTWSTATDFATAADIPSATAVADEVETRTLDANVTKVNGTSVTGSGTSGDPWGPA